MVGACPELLHPALMVMVSVRGRVGRVGTHLNEPRMEPASQGSGLVFCFVCFTVVKCT